MDILFLLIPLSVVLVLIILGGLWWAVYQGNSKISNKKAQEFWKTIDLYQNPPRNDWANCKRNF